MILLAHPYLRLNQFELPTHSLAHYALISKLKSLRTCFDRATAAGLTTMIKMWPQRRLSKEDTLAFEVMAVRMLEALRERIRHIFRHNRSRESACHHLPSTYTR
jgi:hypothetical protein